MNWIGVPKNRGLKIFLKKKGILTGIEWFLSAQSTKCDTVVAKKTQKFSGVPSSILKRQPKQ